jgi:hypothetical protein
MTTNNSINVKPKRGLSARLFQFRGATLARVDAQIAGSVLIVALGYDRTPANCLEAGLAMSDWLFEK